MSRSTTPLRSMFTGLTCATLLALSACAPLVVGGAATTAVVATDRRTTGEQVEDKAIQVKVISEVHRLFPNREDVRVVSQSYAGVVLLLGDVPTEDDKQKIGAAVSGIEKVQRVINQLRVGEVTPNSVRTNDTWITSKVKATLLNTKEVPSRTIDVTTERGIVYLQGRVTEDEGSRAAIAASGVSGVNKVVKLFDIVSPESVSSGSATTQQAAPIETVGSSPSTPSSTTDTGGAQAMPVQ